MGEVDGGFVVCKWGGFVGEGEEGVGEGMMYEVVEGVFEERWGGGKVVGVIIE